MGEMGGAERADLLALGTHACCLFDDVDHRREVLGPYFAAGLERGERIAYFASDARPESVDEYLGARTSSMTLVESGQLLVASAQGVYTTDGPFEPASKVEDFAQLGRQAVEDGYRGLRVYADNGWMPGTLTDPLQWIDYELRVTRMVPGRPLIGLCGFDAADDRALSFDVIEATHEASVGGRQRESSFFVRWLPDGALALCGEVDAFSVHKAQLVLERAARSLGAVPLDLRELAFVDSPAAVALYRLASSFAELRHAPTILRKVWRLLGLDVDASADT